MYIIHRIDIEEKRKMTNADTAKTQDKKWRPEYETTNWTQKNYLRIVDTIPQAQDYVKQLCDEYDKKRYDAEYHYKTYDNNEKIYEGEIIGWTKPPMHTAKKMKENPALRFPKNDNFYITKIFVYKAETNKDIKGPENEGPKEFSFKKDFKQQFIEHWKKRGLY